jgi:hypothetical protein
LTAFYVTGQGGLPVAFDLVTKDETYLEAKTSKQKRRISTQKTSAFVMLLHVCASELKDRRYNKIAWNLPAWNLYYPSRSKRVAISTGICRPVFRVQVIGSLS